MDYCPGAVITSAKDIYISRISRVPGNLELPDFREIGESEFPGFPGFPESRISCFPDFRKILIFRIFGKSGNAELRIPRKSGSLNLPDFRNPGFPRFLILQLQHELFGELFPML